MSSPDATPSMRTSLCDLLGIEYPILSVGFSPMAARAELVSAVSNAGGFGVLAQILDPDGIRVEAERTRKLTDRPFGFNIIIARGGEEDFRAPVIAMIARRRPQ
jgi:nitronate monooxygenase